MTRFINWLLRRPRTLAEIPGAARWLILNIIATTSDMGALR